MCAQATGCVYWGFVSADYAIIDMATMYLGAVAVPLQTSAPVGQLQPIVTETEPRLFASSIGDLHTAVDLVLTGHAPARLVVFDHHPAVDEEREALQSARQRLGDAGAQVAIEALADLIERGRSAPEVLYHVDDEDDPLRLLDRKSVV